MYCEFVLTAVKMQRLVAKILAGIGVFVIPLVCTLIPIKMGNYFMKKGNTGKRALSCLMCFGGGVFFATFMLHMTPEVRNILEAALITPNHIEYPLAEFLMAAGFFVVLLIEKLALSMHEKAQTRKHKKCHDCPFTEPRGDCPFNEEEGKNDTCAPNHLIDVEDLGNNLPNKGIKLQPCDSCECGGDCESKTVEPPAEKHKMIDPPVVTVQPMEEFMEQEAAHHASRSLVLVIALSLHRIFEGMSIGLKYTTVGVWNLFIAVLCHETVIGFSLGLQFVRNRFSDKRNMLYCCLVSLIMPVGVAIGTALVESGGSSNGLDIVNGVLQAISTGTFIYVTFFEILQDEITHADHDMGKVFSLMVGFTVMAGLVAIPEPPEVLHATNGFNDSLLTTVLPTV